MCRPDGLLKFPDSPERRPGDGGFSRLGVVAEQLFEHHRAQRPDCNVVGVRHSRNDRVEGIGISVQPDRGPVFQGGWWRRLDTRMRSTVGAEICGSDFSSSPEIGRRTSNSFNFCIDLRAPPVIRQSGPV